MVKTNSDINFSFHFEGNRNFDDVNNEVIRLNSLLEQSNFDFIIIKRIYSISVELLYNVVYHGINSDNQKDIELTVCRKNNHIILKCSNLMKKEETTNLRNVIASLNTKDFAELRKMKANQIKNGGITEKGGAGLGLIDITMKSQNPVIPTFKMVNSELDWLTLEVRVDLV